MEEEYRVLEEEGGWGGATYEHRFLMSSCSNLCFGGVGKNLRTCLTLIDTYLPTLAIHWNKHFEEEKEYHTKNSIFNGSRWGLNFGWEQKQNTLVQFY